MAANWMIQFKRFCCRSPARVLVTVFLVLLIIGSWFFTNPTPKSELFVAYDSKKPQVLRNGPQPLARVHFENGSHRKKTQTNNLHVAESVSLTRNNLANNARKSEFKTTELNEPSNEKLTDDETAHLAKDSKQNMITNQNKVSTNTVREEKDKGAKKAGNEHYIEVNNVQENVKKPFEHGEKVDDSETRFSKKHGSEEEEGSDMGQKLKNKNKSLKSRKNRVELVSSKKSDENHRNMNEIRPLKSSMEETNKRHTKPQNDGLVLNERQDKNRKEQHFSQMESPNNENNVLIPLVKAAENNQLTEQFKTCVFSICEHTSINLSFHIMADRDSWIIAKETFDNLATACQQHFEVKYHNVQRIAEKLKSVTELLREMFSAGKKSYYHNPVFFLTAALHLALPVTIERVIVLDSDLKFQSDIKGLFDMFSKFESANIMGLAYEQQPTYRHSLYQYRELHKDTKVGDPPPEGIPGFNSGVVLLNLQNMRKAHIYNQLLSGTIAKEMAEKYHFKGNLGDQDFFTLVSFDYHELFYIIPCSWNRQLCRYWERGYEKVFDSYHKCSGPVHVYHGNCKTPISSQSISV